MSSAGLAGDLPVSAGFDTARAADAVRQAYLAVLNRTPAANEQSGWIASLGQGLPPDDLRTLFARLPEAQADLTGLYRQVLGRNPDAGGLAYWTDQLANGFPLTVVQQAIADTPEAQADIAGLYQQVLGRGPDPAELASWQAQLGSGLSLQTMRDEFAGTPEAQAAIGQLYARELGRDPTTDDVTYWSGQLALGQSLPDLSAAFAGTKEAQADLTGLYRQLLGSNPTTSDIAGSTAQLAGGASLQQVRATVAGGTEARDALVAAYHAIFGFDPSADRLAGLQKDILEGASLQQEQSRLEALSATRFSSSGADFTIAFGPPAPIIVLAGQDRQGPDTLVVTLTANSPQDGPTFLVSIDGKEAAVFNVLTNQDAGTPQEFDLSGNWGSGSHDVAITFPTVPGGSAAPGTLSITSLAYDGTGYAGSLPVLTSGETVHLAFAGTPGAHTPG